MKDIGNMNNSNDTPITIEKGGGARVELDHLAIGYEKPTKVVADNICATIEPGTLTCLIGRNGIGKSTLMRTIAHLQPSLGGNIRIGDTSLENISGKQLARMLSIVTTQKPDVFNMTVEEMVAMGRTPYTGFWGSLSAHDKEVTYESMALVGISHLCERKVVSLSDGERQKTMIAKALAQQTPVILLDEPTAFLDFSSKVEMVVLLRQLAHKENLTILLSTHDLQTALQTSDTLWIMDETTDNASQKPQKEPTGDDNTQSGIITHNNKVKLFTGSPEALSASGFLKEYITRPGITFDELTMTVSAVKE